MYRIVGRKYIRISHSDGDIEVLCDKKKERESFIAAINNALTEKEIIMKRRDEKPPLSLVGIAGKILAGIGMGCVGVYIICKAGTDPNWAGWAGHGAFLAVLGSSCGVYIVGKIGDETGNFWFRFLKWEIKKGNETGGFWATVVGSILAWFGFEFVVGPIILTIIERIPYFEENGGPNFAFTLLFAMSLDVTVSIGATIGFNLTRRNKISTWTKLNHIDTY